MTTVKKRKIPHSRRVQLKSYKRENPFDVPIAKPESLLELMIDTFKDYLEEGCPVDVVCDLVGISSQLYNTWVKRGEIYETLVITDEQKEVDEKYYRFVLSVRKARANWLRERIIRLGKEVTPYWQRDITLLERRDRINWGKDLKETRAEDYTPDEAFL